MRLRTLTIAMFLPAAFSTARAQQTTTTGALAPKKQVLSIQPISAVIGVYSAEYERVIGPSVTLAGDVSYWNGFVGENDPSDPRYFSTDLKLRYYPGGTPLRGFSFGGTVGYTSASSGGEECVDFTCSTTQRSSSSGVSAGFELDHGWLLGRTQAFSVILGLGAKRLFITDDNNDFTLAYPTARISVGMAF